MVSKCGATSGRRGTGCGRGGLYEAVKVKVSIVTVLLLVVKIFRGVLPTFFICVTLNVVLTSMIVVVILKGAVYEE